MKEIIGGMITGKTIKHTKNGKTMAFLNVEDLFGTVEVVVFPRDYENNKSYLEEDSKVFVKGRVSEEDDNASKLICESIVPFEKVACELWIQFPDKESFIAEEKKLNEVLNGSIGEDDVFVYLAKEKAMKRLAQKICADKNLQNTLKTYLGESRIKVKEKSIEKI